VACGNYDALAVIDLKTLTVVEHFKTGREPDGVAYSAK
jgi:DNA-binding beta-propeller fold protein YncE